MKKTILLATAATLLLAACHNKTPQLGDKIDTLSWAMGQDIANSLLNGPLNDKLNNDLILQAVQATLDGDPSPLTPEEFNAAFQELYYAAMTANNASTATSKQKQDEVQADYFQKLAENPNVKQHPSGFYYECVSTGKGRNAHEGDLVQFHYRSTIIPTGDLFDDSHSLETPIQTTIDSPMFPALIDAMQLMNAGSTYRFYFPYEALPAGSGLPAYTPLVYEIELFSIL